MFTALCALRGRRPRAGLTRLGPALMVLMIGAAVPAWALGTPPLVVDGDADGVSDEIDDCPYTPPNTPVDAHGCSLAADGDGDGVPDEVDDCPYTPKGARVDAHGCALDSDLDGVPDGIDQCPNSPYGEAVDARGCAPGSAPSAAAASPAGKGSHPRAGRTAAASSARRPAAASSRAAAAAPSSPAPSPAPSAVPTPAVTSPAVAEGSASASTEPAMPVSPSPLPEAAGVTPAPAAAPAATREDSAPALVPAPAIASPTAPAAPAAAAVSAEAGPVAPGEALGRVRFRTRSAELSEAELRHLQELVDQLRPRLKAAPQATLSVIGHREAGEAEGLDRQRAELVRSYLLARGLPVTAVRLGEAAPAAKERSGQRRAVELEWLAAP